MAKKKPSPQMNFYFSDGFAEAFRVWCTENGYHPATVFKTGVQMLSGMTHEQRKQHFATVDDWTERFVAENTPPTESSEGADSSGEGSAIVRRSDKKARNSSRQSKKDGNSGQAG